MQAQCTPGRSNHLYQDLELLPLSQQGPTPWVGFHFFLRKTMIAHTFYSPGHNFDNDDNDDDSTSPSRSDSQAVFTKEAKVSRESDTACLRT